MSAETYFLLFQRDTWVVMENKTHHAHPLSMCFASAAYQKPISSNLTLVLLFKITKNLCLMQ